EVRTPMIVVNMKAYEEVNGEGGLKIAKTCEEVAKELTEEKELSIVVCPPQVSLAWIAAQVEIPCFAQHVDAVEPGSHTGAVTLESIKAAGAVGTLVNHSERRLRIADIDFIVQRARKLQLFTVVCTNNVAVSRAVAALKPYAVAVEPPELIGTGRSVSKVDPAVVEDTVKAVKKVCEDCVVLCGAGITDGDDVRAAIELGADGVLLASGVVKAKDVRAKVLDLTSGL
ncbi:MAG: triose-phosphate isomerase, partial [Candidatus Alkanophagales archaeon]